MTDAESTVNSFYGSKEYLPQCKRVKLMKKLQKEKQELDEDEANYQDEFNVQDHMRRKR